MSRPAITETFGLGEDEAAALGADGATRIRTFRLIVVLAQELRTLMDQLLRPDGLMLPKGDPELLAQLDGRLRHIEAHAGLDVGALPVWVLATETARGVFTVGHYAGVSARLRGLDASRYAMLPSASQRARTCRMRSAPRPRPCAFGSTPIIARYMCGSAG